VSNCATQTHRMPVSKFAPLRRETIVDDWAHRCRWVFATAVKTGSNSTRLPSFPCNGHSRAVIAGTSVSSHNSRRTDNKSDIAIAETDRFVIGGSEPQSHTLISWGARQRTTKIVRGGILLRPAGLGLLMRTLFRASIFAIGFAVTLSAGQKPEDGPLSSSKKGDTIVVQGCVSGSLLKDLRHQKTEAVTGAETAVVYRLIGEKKLLRIIQKEHQDQVLEVVGVVESNPNNTSTHTKEMGRLRVLVGAGEQETSQPGKPPSYPNFRVTSFEVLRPNCFV
jgi:hypothetical protein